jgi:hypothetical protein
LWGEGGFMACEHLITAVRVKLRYSADHGKLAGQPQLVGHQCVACGASVDAEPGQRWLPRHVWATMGSLDDWDLEERQGSLF